ncbi:MAG: type II secretion system protein, partial [Vampirovibrionales bacterium]
MKMHTTAQGFTLSELLVSLAVLGLIAAFAVPKVLNAVGNSSTLAIAKETVSTITTAYDGVKADSTVASVPSSTQAWRLINKLNYVRTATARTGTNTLTQGDLGTTACAIPTANSGTATPCQILMHNGAVLGIDLIDSFNDNSGAVGPSAGNRGKMMFTVDPDGAGDMEPAVFALGFDGRLMAGSNAVSIASSGVYGYGTPQSPGSIID